MLDLTSKHVLTETVEEDMEIGFAQGDLGCGVL